MNTPSRGEKLDKKNVAMVWINYNTVHDMVLPSWIIHCLKIYKIADSYKVYWGSHENWRVKLTAGGKRLVEVKIQEGISGRDALPQLLFVIVIMSLHHIFRKCTGGYKLINLKKRSITKCKWTTSNWLSKMKKKRNPNTVKENISQDIGMSFGIENTPC